MAREHHEVTISLHSKENLPELQNREETGPKMDTKVIKAKALYNYHPSRNGELSLCAGDIVDIIRQNTSGWWDARFEGKEGLIPSNFVEILPDEPTKETTQEPHPHGELPPLPTEEKEPVTKDIQTKTIRAKVLHNYIPTRHDELGLQVGDIVEIIRKNASGWWDAEHEGKEGLLPSNYVEVLPYETNQEEPHPDSRRPTPRPKPRPAKDGASVRKDTKVSKITALFENESNEELEIRPGDIVDSIRKKRSILSESHVEAKNIETLSDDNVQDDIREDPQGAPPDPHPQGELPPPQEPMQAQPAEKMEQPWKLKQGSRKEVRQKEENELLPEAMEIRDRLKIGDPCEKNMNILVLGMQGVGKSTLINSLLMAINRSGRYQELAEKGSYGEGGKRGRAHITLALEKCYIFEHFKPTDEEQKFKCEPWFWDCPGLYDIEDDIATELLRMVIDGKLPEKTNMRDAKDNIKKLRSKELPMDEARQIHIVLVCHAAMDPIPENMLENIRTACKPDKQDMRKVHIIGIVTKVDQLLEHFSPDELGEVKHRLAEELGLGGSEERIFASQLYCHKVTEGLKRSHMIDEVMCAIWDKILSPEYAPKHGKDPDTEEAPKPAKTRKGFFALFGKGDN